MEHFVCLINVYLQLISCVENVNIAVMHNTMGYGNFQFITDMNRN